MNCCGPSRRQATYESAAITEASPSFHIDRPTAVARQRLYARTPGVFFLHGGHTHRSKRTFLLDGGQNPIPSPEFLEDGATKEYLDHTVVRDLSGLRPLS